METNKAVFLKDYKPYPFNIPSIELDVDINLNCVIIKSKLYIEPKDSHPGALKLKGEDLELKHIEIDSCELSSESYELTNKELIILDPPAKKFCLTTICRINPKENTSLEGMYMSGDFITTQCEAEGFRKITFHPDRPDVLSVYTVKLTASIEQYPILLSNGNEYLSSVNKDSPEKHSIIWEDPIPKPSYLFAIVAGDLDKSEDNFITASGKRVKLRVFVERGSTKYTSHAIRSLKRAMKWEEERYNLEYDLDEYNIVAIRHFNMGAMENKGLNIFNSKLILADKETATDNDLDRIESVISHEYFHNWTGNRITCRDWFQLSLKEGLTVYRDQCFSAEQHSKSVNRIENVLYLRNTQFREDQGPTSHSVKPISYKSIDNFYTTTIYEKGSEIIRMLNTILGEERFMTGIETYIKRYDGCAATTEEFLDAVLDGASQLGGLNKEFDLKVFNNWYYQAGTPCIHIHKEWDPEQGKLILKLVQENVGKESDKGTDAMLIPIKMAIFNEKEKIKPEETIILKSKEKTLTITGLPNSATCPYLSIFRGFSAPVKWKTSLDTNDYIRSIELDDDPFLIWDASQNIKTKFILQRASKNPEIENEKAYISSIKKVIKKYRDLDPCFLAKLLASPTLTELEVAQGIADPVSLNNSLILFQKDFGVSLEEELKEILSRCSSKVNYNWPIGKGERQLTGIAWSLLLLSGNIYQREIVLKEVNGTSMTLAQYALKALQPINCIERKLGMKIFFTRWKDRPVILDSWFGLQASTPWEEGIKPIKGLIKHPLFDPLTPNTIRAILGGLASNTPIFHAEDGSGYEFMVNQIVNLDKLNPITASRASKVFSQWKRYESRYKNRMSEAIQKLASADLSLNTREVVDLLING